MTIAEIQSSLETIRNTFLPGEEKNFDKRVEVIDFILFEMIDPLEELIRKTDQPDQLILLKHQAEQLKSELEEIDSNLFKKLRDKIRTERVSGNEFKNLVKEYLAINLISNEQMEAPGYDNLDVFINGLFPIQTMPEQTKDLEPEIVYYQKTPARIIFELARQSHFIKDDVFFDLGSGLGQVAMLINLLTGIKTKGVEFEPAFCNYATECARQLNLSNVTFIQTDARKADYSEGNVFFMYTPFKGKILQEVLALLREESLQRKIKVITYGPCTAEVALQSWLYAKVANNGNIYKPGVFISI